MFNIRVRFFKKIQDWIFKSERTRKLIFRFFTRRINPRSPGSWCLKGTKESTLEVDSSVPLTRHDPRDLGLICLVKKRKIRFQILADFKIQSWIFLKKRTLRHDCCKIILTVGDHISTVPEHVWLENVGSHLPAEALLWQTVSIDGIELVMCQSNQSLNIPPPPRYTLDIPAWEGGH